MRTLDREAAAPVGTLAPVKSAANRNRKAPHLTGLGYSTKRKTKVLSYLNPDLRYLLTRLHSECGWTDNGRFLGLVLRKFGEANVTEALRRVDRAAPVSERYFYGICRNVAGESA